MEAANRLSKVLLIIATFKNHNKIVRATIQSKVLIGNPRLKLFEKSSTMNKYLTPLSLPTVMIKKIKFYLSQKCLIKRTMSALLGVVVDIILAKVNKAES